MAEQAAARRFYKTVSLVVRDDAFLVYLDSRAVRTPKKKLMALGNEALAQGIADEWDAQDKHIDPNQMPLTSFVFTALDLLDEQREQVVEELADFADGELLCYRVVSPSSLVERQNKTWQPLLDWANHTFDACLVTTSGVVHVEQPPSAIKAMRCAVDRHDDMELSALAHAVRLSGSLVISLALSHGRITAQEAFDAAELDETYSLEQWGQDAEAEARRASILKELTAVDTFFKLNRAGKSA